MCQHHIKTVTELHEVKTNLVDISSIKKLVITQYSIYVPILTDIYVNCKYLIIEVSKAFDVISHSEAFFIT